VKRFKGLVDICASKMTINQITDEIVRQIGYHGRDELIVHIKRMKERFYTVFWITVHDFKKGGDPLKRFKEWKRAGKTNQHHDLARRRGGTKCAKNILILDINRHSAYHSVFHNRTLIEAAQLLVRTHNYKNGTKFKIVGGKIDKTKRRKR